MLRETLSINDFKQSLKAGLLRQAICKCSQWAEQYRYIQDPITKENRLFSFDYFPWSRGVHDCEDEWVIARKGAQLGFTEVALNKALYAIDILKESVLYVLPNDTPDAGNFSTSRFDPVIELSPHLRNLFSKVKNIGHKQAGLNSLFIVGSKSKSRLKSNPCGRVICDEVEEMNQENIALIPERMAAKANPQIFLLSTPSLPGKGIDRYYRDSTEDHFIFKCPSCSKLTELVFPDCLIITADQASDKSIENSHLICKECKNVLPHEKKSEWLGKGWWEPTYSNKRWRGYSINQLYSFLTKPHVIATKYLRSLADPYEEQDFWNSKLGLPHEVKGARVRKEDLVQAIRPYQMKDESGFKTIGVDVGQTWFHYEVDRWKPGTTIQDSVCKVIHAGKVKEYKDIKDLILKFQPASLVIDKNPEGRMTLELAQTFPGIVKRCEYVRGRKGKNIHIDEEEHRVTVDRTSWLDLSLGRFANRKIIIPQDIGEEYKNQMSAPVRVYKKDSDGNDVGSWEKHATEDDHFAHARNYAEIAFAIGITQAEGRDLYNVF